MTLDRDTGVSLKPFRRMDIAVVPYCLSGTVDIIYRVGEAELLEFLI